MISIKIHVIIYKTTELEISPALWYLWPIWRHQFNEPQIQDNVHLSWKDKAGHIPQDRHQYYKQTPTWEPRARIRSSRISWLCFTLCLSMSIRTKWGRLYPSNYKSIIHPDDEKNLRAYHQERAVKEAAKIIKAYGISILQLEGAILPETLSESPANYGNDNVYPDKIIERFYPEAQPLPSTKTMAQALKKVITRIDDEQRGGQE